MNSILSSAAHGDWKRLLKLNWKAQGPVQMPVVQGWESISGATTRRLEPDVGPLLASLAVHVARWACECKVVIWTYLFGVPGDQLDQECLILARHCCPAF